MKPFSVTHLALILGFIQAGNLFAGPLHRADLPAQPAWVVHLDVDAFRKSVLGQLVSRELDRPGAQNKLEAFRAMFNFDPRTALHGVSVYGLENKPEDGLMVVYGDFDTAHLESLVRGGKDYTSSKHRSHTIHSWIDEKKRKSGDPVRKRMYGAVAGNRLLFAQREDRLAAALDIVDGFSSNMGTSKAFPELDNSPSGSFFQAAGSKLQVPDGNPNAALVRLSQEMRLNVAESDGKLTATMNLVAKDEEVAGHMNAIAQGLVALMKMQTDKPERVRFAEALSLKQEGQQLAGTLTLPAQDFLDMLKAVAKKHMAR